MPYHVQAGIFKTIGFIQSITTIWFTVTNKLTVNTFTRLTLELFRRTSVQEFISFSTFWKGFITNFPQIGAGRVFDDSFIASWNWTYIIVLWINVADWFLFQSIWVPAIKIRLAHLPHLNALSGLNRFYQKVFHLKPKFRSLHIRNQ